MESYFKTIVLSIATLAAIMTAKAQDGEGLFKAKCSACHMVDKNSTGPVLKGAMQKWADAGEAELMYEWVKNPANLIAAGTSKMAAAIKDYSPTMMNPQAVSNEEIDAILSYVDNYAPPVAAVAPTGDGAVSTVVTFTPNYKDNLHLFYWLLAATFLLVVSIFVMSTTLRTLLKSDALRTKLIEREKKSTGHIAPLILVLVSLGIMAFNNVASALTFNGPGKAAEGAPWLLIEKSDVYLLVIINIVLLGVLWYLRSLFKEFMQLLVPVKEKAPRKIFKLKQLNKVLTDVVEIEDEESILMDHEYDGIRELDNNLPPWWVWMFYATIVFGVIYIFDYHVFRTSDLQIKAYEKDMVESKKEVDAYLSKMAMNVDETNATLMSEASDLSSGKGIFEVNCVSCHNPKGEGNIGPNLTDTYWLYGNDVKNLYGLIKYGNANGMPEHASKLNPIQIQQVSSYVLSMPYAKGKEPQGTEIKKQ